MRTTTFRVAHDNEPPPSFWIDIPGTHNSSQPPVWWQGNMEDFHRLWELREQIESTRSRWSRLAGGTLPVIGIGVFGMVEINPLAGITEQVGFSPMITAATAAVILGILLLESALEHRDGNLEHCIALWGELTNFIKEKSIDTSALMVESPNESSLEKCLRKEAALAASYLQADGKLESHITWMNSLCFRLTPARKHHSLLDASWD